MKISELYKLKKPVMSFEIFPPKPNMPLGNIFNTINELKYLNPDFISVTYGAGGSSKDRTIDISSKIKNNSKIEAVSHLTCVASSVKDIDNTLQALKNKGIENIMALRGDPPKDIPEYDFSNQDFKYASNLISHIKNNGHNFCIGGACYPESHIEAIDRKDDIEKLKLKVNCGVDFLVTQLFFSNEIFYIFLDDIQKAGITCPVSAGIMPVFSTKSIKRMTLMCGVRIPKKLIRILNKYEYSPDDLIKAGISYAVEQIQDLIKNGVNGVHLYTMNKPKQVKEIVSSTL